MAIGDGGPFPLPSCRSDRRSLGNRSWRSRAPLAPFGTCARPQVEAPPAGWTHHAVPPVAAQHEDARSDVLWLVALPMIAQVPALLLLWAMLP